MLLKPLLFLKMESIVMASEAKEYVEKERILSSDICCNVFVTFFLVKLLS
jgi:hypothetical protein